MIRDNSMKIKIRVAGTALGLMFLVSGPLGAQRAAVPDKLAVKEAAKPAAGGADAGRIYGSAWSEVILAAGGGYLFPQGDEAAILDPSWSVKIIAQKNNVAETLFGLGCDISYARLPDKEVAGGSITYVTVLPHATATFPLFDVVNVQFKAGPGISSLTSQVKGQTDSSMSLTLGGGAGFFRVFRGHFVLGVESSYWYYFQLHTSSSAALYAYTGYYF